MKKIAILLILTLLFCAASCTRGAADPDESEPAMRSGGWETPDSPVVTPELKTLTDQAFETFTGAQYEPVAYLAKQVVAGMNHRFLCKTTSVIPNGTQTFSIVELYADLQGNVQITDIVDSVVPTNYHEGEHLTGGWMQPDSPEVTEEVREALRSTGAQNEPIACVGTQVVSGMNYCVLCKTGDADDTYTFVYLYIDLQGNAQLIDAVRFTDGSDNATN